MSLRGYRIASPATVIAADRRDPDVSWENHLNRTGGLRGGVDVVARVGTPIYARTPGWLFHRPNDGSAGNSSRFAHQLNAGWSDVFSHLSRYVKASGAYFEQGELCAYSGDTGGVDPHLHWHLLDPDGVRRNPWHYFTTTDLAGSGQATPIEEEDMTPEQADKLDAIHGALFSGIKDRDLSRPRYEQVSDAVLDLHDRFFVLDKDGNRKHDLTQMVLNEVEPALAALEQTFPRGMTGGSARLHPDDLAQLIDGVLNGLAARLTA